MKYKMDVIRILSPFIFLTSVFAAYSQKTSQNYDILRNKNKVGTVYFSKTTSGKTESLKAESKVRAKVIGTFVADGREEAVFDNGILLHSSLYRQLNGSEKANKQHRVENGQYIVTKGKDSKIQKSYPITYTMLSLYSKEPENISKVYSDNFETFLAIQKVDAHKYKISLPDGNYNYYSYADGVLNLVEIHHSLYSANIVLAR